MRAILVKDFNNFVSRGEGLVSKSAFGSSLFFSADDAWRRKRQIMSPTFSSGKLKRISKKVIDSAESLADFLEECAKAGRLVPLRDTCGAYSSEIIAKTGFGIQAKFIGLEHSQFTKYCKTLLNIRLGWPRTVVQLVNLIPNMGAFCAKVLGIQLFDSVNMDANRYFTTILSDTILERRRQRRTGVTHGDFLDLILEANDAASAGRLQQEEENREVTASELASGPVRGLSDEEVYAESILVIFAGFETTASTLQWALYELAQNPDIQEKAYQEVKRVVKGKTPTQEELKQLDYLDQVINETLRLFPPAPLVDRKARETRTYNGVTIPAGSKVMFPFWHLMRDPRYWETPNTFNPEHFSKEAREKRDPLAFTPFGQGPRLCLGMRLALLELKMALAHLLPRVKVVLNDRTEPRQGKEVKMTPLGAPTPEKPVQLAIELRSDDA
ncbi:cytochrome P450 3A11 [Aplysia californica]|uniref:Cytochrome P450 3A11 n=1 Tax=Aplysia californica TaxID=6500 RepID=A0ABM0KA08_APLCA|nr:cytochrome P450 3A11 [Aplysia californica]